MHLRKRSFCTPCLGLLFLSHALTCSNAAAVEPATASPAQSTVYPAATAETFPPSRFGFDVHGGLGGGGFNVATPLARPFNLRLGADFFDYSTAFKDQGADVNAALRLRSAHASLDWFPFRRAFRLSPLLVFANNNRVQATYQIPAGNTITLNGHEYVSSSANPLFGAGSVDLRRTSPGFTLGSGNLLSRNHGHFSAPLELGFYYAGQPSLKVIFGGSACYPGLPETVACEPVSKDPDFQQNLNAYIARNRHNLSYASFFPVFSAGVGYAF